MKFIGPFVVALIVAGAIFYALDLGLMKAQGLSLFYSH